MRPHALVPAPIVLLLCTLTAAPAPAQPTAARAPAKTTPAATSPSIPAQFVRGADGKVSQLVLHQGGLDMPARRRN